MGWASMYKKGMCALVLLWHGMFMCGSVADTGVSRTQLAALVRRCFLINRSQRNVVIVAGEQYDLALLWNEEPWVTRAACIKSAYKYLAQQNEPPTLQTIKDIFSPTFRFFEEDDKVHALLYQVYNLGCAVLKYAKADSLQFQLAQKAVLHAAHFLQKRSPEPSFWTLCADELPYWGALFMACLSGITLRRPVVHTVLHLCGITKDQGMKGDLLFSAATATFFVACGMYAAYLQARNRMLTYKNEAYELNNHPQPDANAWEMSHTEEESKSEQTAPVLSAQG